MSICQSQTGHESPKKVQFWSKLVNNGHKLLKNWSKVGKYWSKIEENLEIVSTLFKNALLAEKNQQRIPEN